MEKKTSFSLNDMWDAWDVIQLKKTAFEKVYHSVGSVWPAVIILALPSVINLFLSSLLFPKGFGSLFSAVVFWPMMIPLLSLTASIFILYVLLEKWFAFKVDMKGFFKVLAYGSLLLWFSMVPFVLDLMGLFSISVLFNAIWMIGVVWFFVVAYNFLQFHLKPSQRDLLISGIVLIGSYFLVQLILGRLLVGTYYRLFY